MRKMKVRYWGAFGLTGIFVYSLFRLGLLNPENLIRAGGRLLEFAADLFPPRLDILPTIFSAILETIEISFAGTLLGFFISLPLAFLGNRVLFGATVTFMIRVIVGILRTIPSILFGVIFVIAFGLGKTAGTLGVAFYTIGYLAKLYYEAFEAVDAEVIEAVRSTGCNRIQLMRFAILPEAINTVISQFLFMFEYNIRSSTIMGFVGAGGIGYYMLGYIQMLQYRSLLTTILATLVVVMMIDYFSLKIRTKVLGYVTPK